MPKVRLHKFLADCGVASRRSSETIITSGVVTVNGAVVRQLGVTVDPDHDRVCVSGREVRPVPSRLFLFHKPRNVITTMRDPQGRATVAEYLEHLNIRLFPVGRLDYDVVGLLLVTNDGELANRLLHPRFGVGRRYLAIVAKAPTAEVLRKLTTGVKLGDGSKKASVAQIVRSVKLKELEKIFPVTVLKQHLNARSATGAAAGAAAGAVIELVVHEGEKHFVKRLLARVGHPVLALARVGFGPYELGKLKPGELKEVKPPETL